jgi:uncharacterized protein
MSSKIREALTKLGRNGIERLAERLRLDSWQNNVTGFGTGRDKTSYTAFLGPSFLGDEELSNLYHGDDLAARMVDIVPDEMLREGFHVELGNDDLNTEVGDALESLSAREKLANAIRWGRLYGGAALLIGADDGRPASSPLVPEKSKGVSYLYELDRRFLIPLTWYSDPGHSKLGQPETYFVSSPSMHSTESMTIVHESRLLVFGGATTGIREREHNQGWDHSVLQRAFEALRAFNTGWKAVELLLTDGNQAVFKMQGLAEMIGADGTEAAQQRLQIIDLYRSVMRAIVVDAGDAMTGSGAEDFQRHSVSFSDIPATLDKYMLRLAAAVQIPVSVLFGQSPAGMNATGDSDFRWFYDRIRAQQNLELAPVIRRLVRVMLRTRSGSELGEAQRIDVKFPALWTLDPLQEADRRGKIATADAAYVAAGVFLPEEIALARSQPDGFDIGITLTDAARKAREEALTASLEDLGADEPEDEPEVAPEPSNEPPLDGDDDGNQAPSP